MIKFGSVLILHVMRLNEHIHAQSKGFKSLIKHHGATMSPVLEGFSQVFVSGRFLGGVLQGLLGVITRVLIRIPRMGVYPWGGVYPSGGVCLTVLAILTALTASSHPRNTWQRTFGGFDGFGGFGVATPPPNQKTTEDPEIEGSRSQQRSVTDHPPLYDCTEAQ